MGTYNGIDYGMGKTNVDIATGIRYGVISQNSVSQAWCDSAEADYGEPHCPKCGNEAVSLENTEADIDKWNCSPDDYVCEYCEEAVSSDEAFGDEPIGWILDDGDYKAVDCLDSDIMILSSPYYTLAPYCSPCVPGAGNLDDAAHNNDGVKSYCFGHDWFDGGKAPYVVYSVETGEIVKP